MLKNGVVAVVGYFLRVATPVHDVLLVVLLVVHVVVQSHLHLAHRHLFLP